MHYFTIEQREALQALLQSRAGALRAARASAELREVESALERLHSADFGLCAECGEEVAYAYLQTHLLARHCAACEAKHR